MKTLVTGATGLIGTALCQKLIADGHELWVVTRDVQSAKKKLNFKCHFIEADLNLEPIRDRGLEEIEAVVNLMGETVVQTRWTAKIKSKIYKSRVVGTKNLLDSLRASAVKVFVSTSAAGIYGDRQDEVLSETSKYGEGFLAEVCIDWERPITVAVQGHEFSECRFVIFRMPMVLSADGGGLHEMLPFFKRGLGGQIGDGQNWIPWIHIKDAVQKYADALVDPDFRGVYNLCSANPVRNSQFSKALAEALGSRLLFPIPAMALRLRYGEMAHVLLSSQRMVPEHLNSQQSTVRYDTIEEALHDIFGGSNVVSK